MMTSLKDELERVEMGEPLHYRNLTLFPLLRQPAASDADYSLLGDAIHQGLARVTELNGGGSVPELRFENAGDRPVLLLDGEELVGAKQNRVLNLTILAPAKKTLLIPVSCVDVGRWHMTTSAFTTGSQVMYSRARAARAVHVTKSMRTTGTRRGDRRRSGTTSPRKQPVSTPSPQRKLCLPCTSVMHFRSKNTHVRKPISTWSGGF